jgi:mono/diheme cytochrome c family protein
VRASVVALALIAVLAGCGGSTGSTPIAAGGHGKTLFVQQCGSCHKLSDAGTPGIVGGDLDQLHPSGAELLRAIAEGPGAMPEHLVSGRDAKAVAAYVARVAGK